MAAISVLSGRLLFLSETKLLADRRKRTLGLVLLYRALAPPASAPGFTCRRDNRSKLSFVFELPL
jgi:hypothetical protein